MELQKYFQGLSAAVASRHSQLPSQPFGTLVEPTRPTEIYIPTPAVLHNLKFFNSLTSEDVWKCAPPTVRAAAAPTTYHAQRQGYQTTPPMDFTGAKPTTTPNTISQSPQDPTTGDKTHPSDFPPLHTATRQDDTTVGTTASNLTRNSTIHQQSQNNQSHYNKRFHELDEQIKQHQQEFQSIHARFDTLNDQILRSMTIASDHSRQFSHLENQMSDMHAALKVLLARGKPQPHNTPNPTDTQNADSQETRLIPRNLAREIHDGRHDMAGGQDPCH
jgi:hypothetical protein